MAKIISADEIKKTLPGYKPDKAEKYHSESAKQADKEFYQAIKEKSYQLVILLCGGTASGKTEFLMTHLIDRKDVVILDATLSTVEGAGIKIRNISKLNKQLEIYAVIPDDLSRAFIAFLNRDRKFPDTHFYKTHSGCRKTLLWIAESLPSVKIHVVESTYTKSQKLVFSELKFENHNQLTDYLSDMQMTETDIISSVQLKL